MASRTPTVPRRITAEDIRRKLPDISDFCKTYLSVDPIKQPMPVQPTAHYAIGGIPTDIDAQAVIDAQNTVLPGFYAAGECARLGAWRQPAGHQLAGGHPGVWPARRAERGSLRRGADWPRRRRPGGRAHAELEGFDVTLAPSPSRYSSEMRAMMMDNVGVFRTAELLDDAVVRLTDLEERLPAQLDHGQRSALEHASCSRPGSSAACSIWPKRRRWRRRPARRAAARTSGGLPGA